VTQTAGSNAFNNTQSQALLLGFDVGGRVSKRQRYKKRRSRRSYCTRRTGQRCRLKLADASFAGIRSARRGTLAGSVQSRTTSSSRSTHFSFNQARATGFIVGVDGGSAWASPAPMINSQSRAATAAIGAPCGSACPAAERVRPVTAHKYDVGRKLQDSRNEHPYTVVGNESPRQSRSAHGNRPKEFP
jgi:hypothetical protein